jgi:hypothetical protein
MTLKSYFPFICCNIFRPHKAIISTALHGHTRRYSYMLFRMQSCSRMYARAFLTLFSCCDVHAVFVVRSFLGRACVIVTIVILWYSNWENSFDFSLNSSHLKMGCVMWFRVEELLTGHYHFLLKPFSSLCKIHHINKLTSNGTISSMQQSLISW